ncbi:MAG: hypothetical protein A2252_09655 [Elusimicrobia bacterium RIFOXYA2_FULL_39_19]|nr:MAG: hypothetical protein A2252_09655 [Elusimicrobia bacterium RIFOXYA2_FULL_39_19]
MIKLNSKIRYVKITGERKFSPWKNDYNEYIGSYGIIVERNGSIVRVNIINHDKSIAVITISRYDIKVASEIERIACAFYESRH